MKELIDNENIISPLLKVFICHSSEDNVEARNLSTILRKNNFESWLDEEKLLPGQDWNLEIKKALRSSDIILICLSDNSINKKGYIQKEIKFALDVAEEQPEGTTFIIPVKLNKCRVPDFLQKWHYVNFFEDKGGDRLLLSLLKKQASKVEKKEKTKDNNNMYIKHSKNKPVNEFIPHVQNLQFLILIIGIASMWNGFTAVFGTISMMKSDGTPQLIASALLATIILGFLYNTPNIYYYTYDIVGVPLKLLWICAFTYNLTTSYMGNSAFLITNTNPDQIQQFILIGLTFLVSSSPILLSLITGTDTI